MEEGLHKKDDMKMMMMMSSSSSVEERKAIENVVFSKETELVMPPEYVKNQKVRLLRRQALTCYQNLYDPQLTDVLVPYVAMNYFDRFISKHQIPRVLHNKQENIKLFLISCLSISWKMRVNKFNVTKFMLNRGLKFGSKGLMKMELYILNALEWRMKHYLIPFCFVPYFLHYLLMSTHHHLLLPPHFTTITLLKIIVATQADIKFTQFRPSTLAASAILCALAKLLPDINTRNYFKSVIVSRCAPFNNTIDKELADCMELIERIHKNKLNRLMVAGGSTSERVGTSTSQPIDIVPPDRASTSVHPGSQTTSPGDERSHCRHGKELLAAFGDIQTEEADHEQSSSEEAASSKVELNGPALIDNPLMDFELEWDDNDNDEDDHNDGNGHCNLFDALARCWPIPIFEAYENTIDWLQLSWNRVLNLPDRNSSSSSSPNSRSRQGERMVSFQAETSSSSSNNVSFIK